ncbi:hypothetical protein C5E74_004642 [Salmonella enterica subsp. enterica serovar Thompson]|nr:hypothetical protein [Salmonella enterica subsp. enterica serovar Thompson]
MSDFIDFIKTGYLFGLGLNSTALDVRCKLGEPVHIYDEAQHSAIYNYGNIEFIFGRQGVASLEVKLYEDMCGVNILGAESFCSVKCMDFINILSGLTISYKKGRVIDNGFIIFFHEHHRASFDNDILMTISVIKPEDIY